ncbi:transcription antiterminator LacT domain protein [Streptococcus pneumoniae 2070335]|nr:transcription antiterminator LacT domain protein [Streptococcus pneumoniae 2070335]
MELVESIDKRKEILRNVEEVLTDYAIQRTKRITISMIAL